MNRVGLKLRGTMRALALLLLLGGLPGARADAGHHTFWVAKGAHNTVYLLGSVHVLKPSESDLPPEAVRAYSGAKALVMEIDLNNASPEAMLGSDLELARLPEGQSLEAVLGPAVYAKFSAHVAALGLDADLFSAFQPWFVALALQQAELQQQGFDPGAGVDQQFAQRAAADHKPIIALETVEQQLGIFANLSLPQQRRFLSYMLDDADDTMHSAAAVVAAWRNGDVHRLEQLLSESSDQYPELFRMLTSDRNRQWLPTVTGLLHEQQDYLVIVGALHLVGHDGLVQLLQQEGYEVVQH